jgi:hypothetical protein
MGGDEMKRIIRCLTLWISLPALSMVQADVPQGVDVAALEGWNIVVAADALPSEQYAAEEFQAHLEQASGLRLPIVATINRPGHHVFIGATDVMQKSNVGFQVKQFGPEDLRIVVRDGNIAIAGGRPRGTLYGVYSFLEDYFGVRFLTADHTHVPPIGRWKKIGPVDRIYHPPFAMRWSYYGEINRNPTFATRMRVNTIAGDPKLGGKTGIENISHSFSRQIPSQKYGNDHPEYYCLMGGERLANVKDDSYDNEPCLTNPDVLRIVTEAVLAEIAQNPHRENISVSQNDNDKYCRCDTCAVIDQREGTPMGSLLTFVNAVADQVGKKYPDVRVGTLSYWYTRKPPRSLQPRPNVQIQLCSIECCLIHAINDPSCPRNVDFCRDVENWGEICKNVSIWNYNTNFRNYLLPCPNLRVIEPNVRFFVANKAKGVFMQAAGNARSAEFSELRNYIISNLIWDPSRSGETLMNEFLQLHYGSAAPPIRRYIDLIADTAENSGVHRNCFARSAKEYGIDDSVAARSLGLFDEAMRLADNDEVKHRVEKASIAAYRLAIDPVWDLKDIATADPEMLEEMRPLVSRFLNLCEEHGVDQVAERESFSSARERLEQTASFQPR